MSDKIKAEVISKRFNSEYPSHNYPIHFKEAKEIRLHVKHIYKELHDNKPLSIVEFKQ